MRRLSLILVGFLLADGATSLSAQNSRPASPQLPPGNGEIRGTVVDGTAKTPIARASVAVRSKPGAVLVAGAIANTDGAFRIQGLRPGSYTLRVTYLGYGPQLRDVTIADATPIANVGAIALSHVAVSLQGVDVREERATVTIEPDRNSYRAKDVAPAAGNASEVLDATPSVQVDADGKVSLRGNENVAVQINGRPAPITGAQLGAYLKALPASIVERVEVVPNPSARYDPEGMAGIINIVLKQNTDLGVSGGLNVGFAQANRYNGSGNIGYQSGPLTLLTTLGVNHERRNVLGINDRQRLDALLAPQSFTNQDIAGETGFSGQNLTSTMDYRFNPRDLFSNSLTLNRRGSNERSLAAYEELDATQALLDSYDRARRTDSRGFLFDYTSAFKRTFEPRKHELSAEVRFNRARDTEGTSLWRQTAPTVDAGFSRREGELDNVVAVTKQLTAQLDYTKTLAARAKLETGVKSTTRWLDRDFRVQKDALGTGSWVPSDLSNAFNFDETVQAAYGVLSKGAGRFDLQAGLRGEYARRDFSLAAPAQRYPYSYGSLFPSGVVSYNVSDALQTKLSYSRRVRRPGTQELNPFPSFFDAQNVFFGNPSLSPEYTDAIELGVTRSGALGSLQLSPFYRHTTNVIRVLINTADVVDGREVTSVSFENLAKSNSWGTDVNGSLKLGKRLNAFAGFNVFKMVTDGGSQSVVGSDAVTWSSRVNASTELTPRIVLQGSYFYRAPMKIERGEFSSTQMANFSIKQKLDGDNATVTLRVTDPFNTGRFRIKAGDDNIVQITERSFGVRAVFLTFQYTYGQVPKIRPPRPEENAAPQSGFP